MDIVTLAQAVMAAGGALTALLLLPVVRAALETHYRTRIENMSRIYVYAAEQIYGAGRGKEKLAYVTRALSSRGVKLDEHNEYCIVRSSIEAAVREIKYIEENINK